MTNAKILEQTIQKAIDGGFSKLKKYEVRVRQGWLDGTYQEEPYIYEITGTDDQWIRELSYQQVIFDLDFAMALWGIDTTNWLHTTYDPGIEKYEYEGVNYLYHLQQLVIAKDRFKYLEEHIV